MHQLFRLVAVTGLALIALPGTAAETAPPRFLIAMRLTDAGKVIGAPSIQATAGKAASVSLQNPQATGYTVAVTATPVAPAINVALAIHLTDADGRQRHFTPALQVRPGSPASVEIGDPADQAKVFRIDVRVDPVTG